MSNCGEQEAHFQALFERTDDYNEWTVAVADLVDGLADMGEAEARRRAARLRRDFEAIAATDYFPGRGRARAEATLRDLETAVNGRFSPGEPGPAEGAVPPRDRQAFQGRRLATRESPWVDRVARA